MNERPLDLDTVKAFIRIAELGSFTLAADSLRMTQAAVSLKLKRLEDRLGFRLVERTPTTWSCRRAAPVFSNTPGNSWRRMSARSPCRSKRGSA